MKKTFAALALTTALIAPGLAMARPVTLTATLNSYRGEGADLALYVTDASGAYVGSLWMAGRKSRYDQHLTGWYRAMGRSTEQVSGITGASVGGGRRLEVTVDLADSLFDAGYTLHLDAAVEDSATARTRSRCPRRAQALASPRLAAASSPPSPMTCNKADP
ncbi:hypothetical protein ROA7023_02946 [Roseisalinus antarcticus]|uniref:Tat pathway signal protein n=1 Tax=Roseisalinus antarcticus TaxID=254357 RepID=A0A1Y5TFS8_9RHOB|nr:hypothetical protein ROA7023_02946 [Roseisalinus antarcticus]